MPLRRRPGCRPPAAARWRARRASAAPTRQVRLDRLDELLADGVERVERGQRVLEDRADLAAADLAHLPRRAGCRCAGRRAGSRPPAMRPGGSSRPMMAAPVSDLPAPDSPTTPRTSPGAMSKRDVVERRAACRAGSGTRRAGSRTSSSGIAADAQRSFGLSASRSQSPSRLTDSTMSDQRDAGEDRDPPFAREQEIVADPDQRAERRLGRRHADAEERQRRLGDDRERRG